MTLPPGFLDEIGARLSLARIVGRKLTWDPRKTNAARGDYWAPCPFHQEKTASFHVDDAKGFYYCFGCQAKGDMVSFVRATENVGFMEAVERLAREAGIALPERDPRAEARRDRLTRLADAVEAALQFYRLNLASAKGAEARAYLDRRGTPQGLRDRFELGYAPDGFNALAGHLAGKGFAPAELVEAGLLAASDKGGAPYDRFRNRLVFPIRDGRGRAIGFGGRALGPGQEPKYLNSPETPLFDKGRSLYNLGPARAAAGRAGRLVVVEGYTDVIALAAVGIDAAVAPLGTAITEDQLGLLWRLHPEPTVALDGDRAGLAAAERLIDRATPLLSAERALRFVILPPGQDPDDVVRTGGAAAIEALLAASRPLLDLVWTRETEAQPLDSPERRAALVARLRARVEKIADKDLRARYAAEFRARSAALFAPARPARPARDRPRDRFRRDDPTAPRPAFNANANASAGARASLLGRPGAGPEAEARIRECAVLAGLLQNPDLAPAFEDRLERLRFLCPDLASIRDALLSALAEPLSQGSSGLAARIALRLGRDPLAVVLAPGQVRAHPHLAPGTPPDRVTRAIEEALAYHTALLGRPVEISEAQADFGGAPSEEITERLRAAAEALDRAAADPRDAQDAEADREAERSDWLQSLIDGQSWRKPARR